MQIVHRPVGPWRRPAAVRSVPRVQPDGEEAAPATLAEALTEALTARLGDRVVSVVGHGSWVHGDFCPGRSDLDLVVVLRDEPGPDLVAAVQPLLSELTGTHPRWRDRLELGFVDPDTIRAVLGGDETSRRVGRVSPGEPLQLVAADRHRLLDWDAAHHGRTLYGTPSTEAIPSVPLELLHRVVVEHLRSWPGWLAGVQGPGFPAYAVLTVSRAAAYLGTGDRYSKRRGAGWASTRWPQWRPVIGWAVDWWYEGGSDEDPVPSRVEQFVAEVAGSADRGRVLEPMQEHHLDEVVAVQEEGSVAALAHVFPQTTSPFPRAALRRRWAVELADPGTTCFVIRGAGTGVQGFAATRGDQLLHFGTARSTWGSGLARLAHDELLDELRASGMERATLWVFEENHHARHFYEHRGWVLTDERKRSGFPPHPLLLGYARDLSRP